MNSIITKIKSLEAYLSLKTGLEDQDFIHGLALPRSARLPVVTALYEDSSLPLVLIVDRADHALSIFDELSFWAPQGSRYLFSEPNPLFYEDGAWGITTRRERLQALTALAAYHLPYISNPQTPPIIITTARALMTRTLPRREFIKAVQKIKLSSFYQPEALVQSWVKMGYELEDTVLEPGKFSRRGGLLDVWPPSESLPARLDFFGDEIESIRQFDPATQRTLRKQQSLVIPPAREFLLPDLDQLQNRNPTEFDIPILHPISSCLLDYLPEGSLVILDDLSLVESTIIELEEQAVKLKSESIAEGILQSDFPVPYFSLSEINDLISSHKCLELGYSSEGEDAIEKKDGATCQPLAANFKQLDRFGGRLKPIMDYLRRLVDEGNSVQVVSRQAARLEDLWNESYEKGKQNEINFFEASLTAGLAIGNIYLLTDSEIFGWERPQMRTRPSPSTDTPELAYADLKPGDWVVHMDYGIGLFAGLVRRTLDGLEREFLLVDYQNGDQVYVPIHQADRLARYIGPGGSPPSLGHLGTQEWSEAKKRVNNAVQEVAQELLDLYARRQVAKGYAFQADVPWQGELESSFPYVETHDQMKALEEIKHDMEDLRPMDRLLCGDVGYGKTEVALRAAFKAVMDGKQVAVLVPTTVLAQQHFDTFRQRLTAFPVTVEMLSRFRTTREQNQIIYALATGGVDIVIGTHRLISADVQFKDLGLVIIDEEQRFGVTHKERLKQLRTEVDVLTLTATPIPRTLYMALTGVRDISNLNTPPEERLPIVTHIGPYAPKLVRQAVLRELERGGQVFFVHNRVQTIHAMKMHLEKLVPEARIAIGHGQMPEQDLASVMHKFTAGEVDILLATSIIESGLDIPNANTLIVDRADAFGLAQLYQLRGRVGRGAARAYSYFFRHRKIAPTPEGQERMEVIAENSQLGAGYSIAMRDLEMRGAGELLGTRQSGHIASVGFHLYTRLLSAAVKSLRLSLIQGTEDIHKDLPSQDLGMLVNVDLPLASGIPEEYVQDQSLRLRLYRRLANIEDESGVDALTAEFTDRFGPPPEMVENLFFQIRVKLRAEKAGIILVGSEMGQIVLRYPPPMDETQVNRLPDLNHGVRGGKNAYWCTFAKEPGWQVKLLDVLEQLKK